jgi:DNA uptake protein ComE-like DNA-binding protein
MRRERGSILVGLLWCIALVAVLVVSVLHSARLDLFVAKNHADGIQAHYLALAGVERAKAILHQDAKDRTRSARHHTGDLYNSPQLFKDVKFGRGEIRVFRQGSQDEGGQILYGISDEESRLNLNVASTNELIKLPGLNIEIAAAIQDWRDSDDAVSPGGAEAAYYTTLMPPYRPRNGPFQTTRELLMVRGVTRDLLLGDASGAALPKRGGRAGLPNGGDQGWYDLLTVNSAAKNVNAAGQARVDVQNATEGALTGVKGITPEIARAIVAYRGRNQLQSIFDLLDVTAAPPGGANPGNNPGQQPGGANPGGPKVISDDLLQQIADDVTTDSNTTVQGVVNINTASLEVLYCLPGIDVAMARAIINRRSSEGFFPHIAALLKVPGMNRDMLKELAPRITVRSDTFRILSEGKVGSTGARRRMEVVVRQGLEDFTTLTYREDDL